MGTTCHLLVSSGKEPHAVEGRLFVLGAFPHHILRDVLGIHDLKTIRKKNGIGKRVA
jgi:hypothetical protein